MSTELYFVKVAIPAAIGSSFDYLPPEPTPPKTDLLIGSRVKVPFGKRILIGFITQLLDHTTIAKAKLKTILEIIDPLPILPAFVFSMLTWASSYYYYPLGQVLKVAFPKNLRSLTPATKKVRTTSSKLSAIIIPTISTALILNNMQQAAVNAISLKFGTFAVFLLHGITGSGKTEVYLQLAQQVLARNQQVLILIPEIGLTPQTLVRFQERFQVPITVLHSQLTDKERANAWLQANSGASKIILGTRSAAFVPLKNPGLYIIDEEHDPSFKQQVRLRYSARDFLIRRAKLEHCPILLGSATPALESLYNANTAKYNYLLLPTRAGNAALPSVQILDIRHKRLEQGLSAQLITAIKEHLANNGQVLLFLNRRGYAPVLMCHACGWVKNCSHCTAKMILHYYPRTQLICHHCQAKELLPNVCPQCLHVELNPLGLGTERLEEVLKTQFPLAQIARIDRDITQKKDSFNSIIEQIHAGKINIILGTQMLAKGHHFPNIALVAILDIDSSLFSADFRATERLGQLITQVSGRAGRAVRPGHVMIQTHHPDHYLLKLLLTAGYTKFCAALLEERKAASLPPFSYQVLLRSQAKTLTQALQFLALVKHQAKTLCLAQSTLTTVTLLGPVPAPMEKRIGNFHGQLLLQAPTRKILHNLCQQLLPLLNTLPQAKSIRWSIDVDPIELY